MVLPSSAMGHASQPRRRPSTPQTHMRMSSIIGFFRRKSLLSGLLIGVALYGAIMLLLLYVRSGLSQSSSSVIVPGQIWPLAPGSEDGSAAGREGTEHSANGVNKILSESDFPPAPPSPYEKRWPRYKLPNWATKPFFLRADVPADKKVCFVHVGKTAGSSLGCYLGFQLHCSSKLKIARGLLPKYTTNVFHNGVNDCPDDAAYFLFALRNPLERIKSWFVYDRPDPLVKVKGDHAFEGKKLLYLDCPFKTLNDLAELGLRDSGNATKACKGRAHAAIQGTERFGYHAFFNYGYYYLPTPKNAKIMVARTEYLVEDWNSIEAILGGRSDLMDDFHKKNVKQKSDADKYLSDESRSLLCEALCSEIQVYKMLLRKAVNLDSAQVQMSQDELHASCPVQVRAESCPNPVAYENINYSE